MRTPRSSTDRSASPLVGVLLVLACVVAATLMAVMLITAVDTEMTPDRPIVPTMNADPQQPGDPAATQTP